MATIDLEPWEPEETVGKLWHAYASRLDSLPVHDGARVDLSEIGGRLAVLFRGLGGSPSVEIKATADEVSHHRLSLRRFLGNATEATPRSSFDGAALRLPASLAVFPAREANAALYLWLAAAAAHAPAHDPQTDPLCADLACLRAALQMARRTLAEAPGLRSLYADLCTATLGLRQTPHLPEAEATVEAAIRHLLGDAAPLGPKADRMVQAIGSGDYSAYRAPRRYRPFRPVALWPDLRAPGSSQTTGVESRATEGTPEEGEGNRSHRAKRRAADQAERNDSFILHKFEAILSWAEFINLNRRVEDDDTDDAKKAADDAEEIGLGQISKAPATRLKLHLDLAPEDVDREALSGISTYPEWDVRTGAYLPAHVRVLTSDISPVLSTPPFRDDPRASARIRAVKRQFEALRPARISTTGHPDGDELDTDRAVRARVDFYATGQGDDRIWRQTRPQKRDLAVSILLDVSRSTESAVPGHGHGGRSVIDIEREALAALSWGLAACGDDFAIHAFSSLKRDRVYIQCAKRFGEPMSDTVEHRIAALKPGFYTRLGAAIRHASVGLSEQARKRRLLLVITDGKPNDLDHYEGRHGIEDSHKAVLEARRMGHAVFGITVDRDGKSWFPRMFGQGGFALIPQPEKLTQALPEIYRQLVGA
ncbi:nitric oxide reductase activation protein NorD [Rhodobacter ferrooxidans]|uniref:von Willebrand factor type A n=1 Tax=Rhodobacter ferrooxidans TaxID=371731 RepID=C8RWH8_9RHOB|nr:VWA domain-containing protein [Rhodobacter sp. SW2]EEW26921.1 von Willebrand factor type A [Rhodobacter sp. SW2]